MSSDEPRGCECRPGVYRLLRRVVVAALAIVPLVGQAIDASKARPANCVWDLAGDWYITVQPGVTMNLQLRQHPPQFTSSDRTTMVRPFSGTATNAAGHKGIAWGYWYPPPSSSTVSLFVDWDLQGTAGRGSANNNGGAGYYDVALWGEVKADGTVSGGTAYFVRPGNFGVLQSFPEGPWRRNGKLRCVPGISMARTLESKGLDSVIPEGHLGVISAGMENDSDRTGADYRHFRLSTAAPALCQGACFDDHSRCKSWTFVRAGVQGSSAICYLKGAVPVAKPNKCCVSGLGMR